MMVLSVVTTAVQVVGEIKAAKAQNKAIQNQFEQQQEQISVAETTEINDRQRAARREQARIKVAAGEAGLNIGGSIESLLMDSLMQNTLHTERTKLNADTQREASAAEANAMFSRVQKPTVLGAGLRIATAGVQGYYAGKSLQISRAKAEEGPPLNG
jgi:hypothetical protein